MELSLYLHVKSYDYLSPFVIKTIWNNLEISENISQISFNKNKNSL